MKNENTDAKPVPATEVTEAAATPKPRKPAAVKKPRKAQPKAARPGTKKAAILKLLQRPNGATLPELMKATKWQAHSVRGFLSTFGKKEAKLKVIDRSGERAYQAKS